MVIWICGRCGYVTSRDENRCHICGVRDWLMTQDGMEAAEKIRQRVVTRAIGRMALQAEINRATRKTKGEG